MLHITNGESVSLAESGLGGEIVFWVDTLYDGPVPDALDAAALTRLRDTYFAGDMLARRDAALAAAAPADDVVLWFEHDLYDQLQLIQVLDHFAARAPRTLSLICIEGYLGTLTGADLAALWPRRHSVTDAETRLATAAWHAFRSSDPTRIELLLRGDCSALPFLAGALIRHLQQFPSVENGLSRTEGQILDLVAGGHRDFYSLFRADQRLESRVFLGDTTFRRYLRGLAECRQPLIEDAEGELRLTQIGRDVRAGRADQVHTNGINRWLGGVHLEGFEARWRWSEARRALAPH